VCSDCVMPADVRASFSLVNHGLGGIAEVLQYIRDTKQHGFRASGAEIEEMYSLQLLCSLTIWHDSAKERNLAATI